MISVIDALPLAEDPMSSQGVWGCPRKTASGQHRLKIQPVFAAGIKQPAQVVSLLAKAAWKQRNGENAGSSKVFSQRLERKFAKSGSKESNPRPRPESGTALGLLVCRNRSVEGVPAVAKGAI